MRVSHHQAKEGGAPEEVLSHHVRQEPEPEVILHPCHCVVSHYHQVRWHLAGPLVALLNYLLQGLTEHLQKVVLTRIYI